MNLANSNEMSICDTQKENIHRIFSFKANIPITTQTNLRRCT